MLQDPNDPVNPPIDEHEFQFALKELVGSYQPVLERELELSRNTEELSDEARRKPPSCGEEISLANQIFERFFTEDVAEKLLGPEGRRIAGDRKEWLWCFRHIRCCIVFGWLVCRGQRTFRSFAYYLYRYWICVREALGTPVSNPLTDAERRDFQILIDALAGAYKPYLTDQLAAVEYPYGIPDEVLLGRIDCWEGGAETAAIFDRLLSAETAPALLGREVFQIHSKHPFFRFCRCWCLCSIRFGCCLARARNLHDVVRCLREYFVCVRRCFRPLIAEIDTPGQGACAQSGLVAACPGLIAIPVTGSAGGSSFTHYTLRYRWGGGPLTDDAVVYPNCGRPPGQTNSNNAVNSGILGYLDQTLLPPGETAFEVVLDVFGGGGLHLSLTRDFKVKTNAIEITQAAQVNALVAPDPFHPAVPTKLIKASNDASVTVPELSIGGAFTITGSAYTVGCDRILSQFGLSRFDAPAAVPVPDFSGMPGGSAIVSPVVYADNPSHPWQSGCFPVVTPNTILNGNLVAFWSNNNCLVGPPVVPKVKGTVWNSAPLNGRFALQLQVNDRVLPAGAFPGVPAGYDQVVVWIDNRQPVGSILSIGGVSGCGDLHLKDYVGATAKIVGIAYDPPIDPTAPQLRPNDNFGSYSLSFQKNGGSGGAIPAATPTQRVPNVWPGPPPASPGGTLADWDIVAALDGGVGPLPPGSEKLARGQRCAYVIALVVSDQTHVGDSGSHHSAGPILYAINVINDI